MSVARKYGRLLGSLLSVACLAWVVHRFASGDVSQRVLRSAHVGELALHISIAAVVYGSGVVLLALAWWFLQKAYAGVDIRILPSMGAYLLTQIGKYLPGNVAQYVGRHLLLRRKGMSHTALVCCTLTEAGLLTASALLFAATLIDRVVPIASPGWVTAGTLTGVAVLVGGFGIGRNRISWLRGAVPVFAPVRLLVAFGVYLLFFALMGSTLLITARAVGGVGPGGSFLVAAAALSWLAGYFVIGAPAGLGVREAVFLALLKGALPEEGILLLVAAFRAATFGGDVLAFLLAAPFTETIRGRAVT